MRLPDDSPAVSVCFDPPSLVETDWLALVVFEGDDPDGWDSLKGSSRGEVQRALTSHEFRAKPYRLFLAPVTDGALTASRVALVGAGARETYTGERARKLATTVALAARERRATRVAFVTSGAAPIAEEAQAVAEGLVLAGFQTSVYKTDAEEHKRVPAFTVVLPGGLSVPDRTIADTAVARGSVLGACSNLARGLANEPANRMTPRMFADRVRHLASGTPLSVDIVEEGAIRDMGMGLLLGVAQGSSEPPRVVVLRYEPAGMQTGPILGLVGKGVTFDSGGISIKPSDGMFKMKTDMSGGAAVVAAMLAIATLKPDVRVVGVVPLAENMPSGAAMRPGDVFLSAEGKTVEVLDTDAEGRLLLADGLWYARRLGATHLVDVATLTGSVQVALGRTTSGLLGGPEWWLEVIRATANRAGDRSWILPTFDDYKELLRSEIADLANVGGRAGGAISAALFLKDFAGGLPWAHLDIAGTAWADDAQPFQQNGPTGVAVRTLAELAFTSASWKP
jgi:leucyl aminopeptidase